MFFSCRFLKGKIIKSFFICFAMCFLVQDLFASSVQSVHDKNVYRVGVMDDPPFVMNVDGSYQGISVEVWEKVAETLGVQFQYVPLQTNDPLEALQMLEQENFDVLLGSVGANFEQYGGRNLKKTVEYSRPYFVDTIGTLEEKSVGNFIYGIVKILTASIGFWVLVLFFLFSVYVITLWYFERNAIYEAPDANKKIPRNALQFLEYSIWKQLVQTQNMTRVPNTLWGKVSLTFWTCSSYLVMLLLSSSVISYMTTSLREYDGNFTNLGQLENVRTISIKDRIQTMMVQERGLKPKLIGTFDEGVKMLQNNEARVMIVSGAHADYYLRKEGDYKLYLSPLTIQYILYAFALKANSPLLESVNQTLTEFHRTGEAQGVCKHYLSQMQIGCL